MTVSDRIENLKNVWFLTEPVYYVVLVSHTIEYTDRTDNIMSGHGKIFINEKFFDSIDDDYMDDYFKAECLRILLRHPYERILPNRIYAYTASNAVISDNLKFRKINIPNSKKIGLSYSNNSYEDIYNYLVDKATKAMKESDNDNPFSLNTENCLNNTTEWDDDPVYKDLIESIVDRAERLNNWGSIPFGLEELIKTDVQPRYDYLTAIRLFRKDVVSQTRLLTRMRPNRRYGYQQMGSKYGYETNILIVCDTSGSMSSTLLSKLLGFVGGFFNYGFKSVDLIQFDTNVYDKTLQTFKKKPNFLKTVSRGGTNIEDIFDYVNKRTKKKYGGIVICSDGVFSWNDSYIDKMKNNKYLFCITERSEYETLKNRIKKNNIKITYIDALCQ